MKKKTLTGIGLIAVLCIAGGIVFYSNSRNENDELQETLATIGEEGAPIADTPSSTESGSMGSENLSDLGYEDGDYVDPASEEIVEDTTSTDSTSSTSTSTSTIEIVEELDEMMYAVSNCNARKGDSTSYEVQTQIERLAYLHVTGLTANNWYRIDWSNESVYVRADLLSPTKPTTNNTNTENSNNNESTPSSNSSSTTNDNSSSSSSSQQELVDQINQGLSELGGDWGDIGNVTIGGEGAGKW
ncbi:MAG: hypothetical protein J6K48_03235 [Lachnospiraceae bacterium]|nr:hypothetical protein [Lachnospiraceae bacterium]